MAGKRPAPGKVEAKYRAWVGGLGPLNPREEARAEQMYAVARQLDAADGSSQPLAATAAVSRQLSMLADQMREVSALPAAVPEGAVAAPASAVDEIGARRAARRAEA